MTISWTDALAHSSRPPMGAKMMPTAKNMGKTVLGVRIGCHAFNRCCLNAVSARVSTSHGRISQRPTGRPPRLGLLLVLLLLVDLPLLLLDRVCMRHGLRHRGRCVMCGRRRGRVSGRRGAVNHPRVHSLSRAPPGVLRLRRSV